MKPPEPYKPGSFRKRGDRAPSYTPPPPRLPRTEERTAVTQQPARPGLSGRICPKCGTLLAVVLMVCIMGSWAQAITSTVTAPQGGRQASWPDWLGNLRAAGVVIATDVTAGGAQGNGIADDTQALRRAIAVTPPHGTLVVPAGTYVLSPQADGNPMLMPKSNLTMACAPGSAFIQAAHTINGGNAYRMLSNLDATGTVQPLDNFTLQGCTFNGNCRADAVQCSAIPTNGQFAPELVAVIRGSHIRFDNDTFIDTPYGGFAAYTGSDIQITHSLFYGIAQLLNGDAAQFNGVDGGDFSHNTLYNVGEGFFAQNSTATVAKEGAGATATLTQNITIEGNVVVNLAANEYCQANGTPFACCTGEKAGTSTGLCSAGFTGGSAIGTVGSHITINGNTVRSGNSINVQAGRGFEATDITVSNNTMVDGIANCVGVFSIASVPAYDVHRVHVVGNHCYHPAGSGVQILASATGSAYDIAVENNEIQSPVFTCYNLKYQTAGGAAIIRDITISGGTCETPCSGFVGGTCGSVYLQDNTSPTFTNVTVRGGRYKGSTRYMFWLTGTQTDMRVEDNDFILPTSGIVNFVATGTIAHWVGNRYETTNPFVTAGGAPTLGQVVSDEPETFAHLTAANMLGNVSDGSRIYCSNCDPPANPPVACTSAGARTGAAATRLNGAWICHA